MSFVVLFLVMCLLCLYYVIQCARQRMWGHMGVALGMLMIELYLAVECIPVLNVVSQ